MNTECRQHYIKLPYIHHQGWKFDVPFQISEMKREALSEVAAKPAKVETEPEEFGFEGCESRLGLESPNLPRDKL